MYILQVTEDDSFIHSDGSRRIPFLYYKDDYLVCYGDSSCCPSRTREFENGTILSLEEAKRRSHWIWNIHKIPHRILEIKLEELIEQ